ncbi:hypothetical protein COL77_21190 [Bacillus wiedmannii]|nr:hypothetical protein CN690_06260 [Bacillus wiedmannii]PEM29181.1 hypothetical protein CN598_15280 [Bacillus wiedmannii]PEP32298.1 hypothetical protein CN566_01310 [Bacillus wiedmannii]PFZ39993.1 hypothetical protein COL77_21190 [Bacillus wiedmannii]PGA82666.1 hypothetical protein COL94_22110 [Bacillus wiedmannii]
MLVKIEKAVKKTQKKFPFTSFQRLVGDKALKKDKPAVGTRLVLADLLQKTQKKVSIYPVPTAGRG